MIRTASPLFLATVLSTSLFAAACSDEDRTSATFSTLDEAHLVRTLDVVAGRDLGSLYIIGLFIAGSDEPAPACPTIVTSGNVTTVTGGCTNEDGLRIDGRVIATNMPGLFTANPAYDPAQPSTVEAIDFRSTAADGSVESVDGKATLTTTETGAVLSGTIDALLDGIDAHTELTTTCDSTDLCTLAEGAWIELDGVGAAELSGTYRFDDPAQGAIVATGAEQLLLDVAASTDSCRTYRIGDAAPVQLCDETGGESAKRVRGMRLPRGL